MRFAWDETKNKLNKQKHGLSFELAKHTFDDPHLLSWLDDNHEDYQEERWINLGCINNLLVIVIIHTLRKNEHAQEIIRIISARKATKKEREAYFQYRQGLKSRV